MLSTMSIPTKVKEHTRLLDLSSDEESEDLQLEIISNRKRKMTRKERNRHSAHKVTEPSIAAEVQCALIWAFRGSLILWLLLLTWVCASVYVEVTTMKGDISKVSISSNGVGDALQICHTAAKELRANASELNIRLSNLELKHQELTERLNKATMDLATVSEQLSAAPKLADTPKRLGELQLTVADFGSQIKGFDSALTSTRKQAVAATAGLEEVRNLLQQLEGKNNDTIVHLTNNEKRESELTDKIFALNSTLVNRIDSLETKIEEMRKPASTAAPATVVPSSVVPPATGINSTTSTSGPLKPIVLH